MPLMGAAAAAGAQPRSDRRDAAQRTVSRQSRQQDSTGRRVMENRVGVGNRQIFSGGARDVLGEWGGGVVVT
jgi:hypothetical protein